jgi:integrase
VAQKNPCSDIKPSDVLKAQKRTNFARIDAKELPELLRKIEAYQGTALTRMAIKLMSHTFVRTSELIGARWDEIDFESAEWRLTANRMKMKTPHIVPLSRQALEVLRVLHHVSGTNQLLFPGERDHAKPMSNNTILKALEIMGYKGIMTGHGFRGVASTAFYESGEFEPPHIEAQLAHAQRSSVAAAYNHAQYLPQRAAMMAWWGNYIESAAKGNVVPLRKLA